METCATGELVEAARVLHLDEPVFIDGMEERSIKSDEDVQYLKLLQSLKPVKGRFQAESGGDASSRSFGPLERPTSICGGQVRQRKEPLNNKAESKLERKEIEEEMVRATLQVARWQAVYAPG